MCLKNKELHGKEELLVTDHLPTVAWLRRELRNNLIVPLKKPFKDVYVVGSEARGTATASSDLDIAIVIPPIQNKSSLKATEAYHQKFKSETFKPKWRGRVIDVQLFYPGDEELGGYEKIKLV